MNYDRHGVSHTRRILKSFHKHIFTRYLLKDDITFESAKLKQQL